ncbi:uncharacterized protein LOC113389009 [Ctenocephalides felis]|uniref:uncharacterized protein LOC113389009 n=1 Tax=Ctenocephalides felis TaxID=7515 RepID=UPI000E6E4BE5|nr:uncharacterized protein LOC113389009 [Ctenocephalides felis]
MIEMHSDLESDEAPLKNIGFSYITDANDDSGVALNQCTDGFRDVKRQVLEQKNCLNEMLNLLRNQIKDKPVCTKCQKPIPDLNATPENDSLFKECLNETKWATPISSTSQMIAEDLSQNRGPSNLFRPISEDNLKTDDCNDSEENYETMVSKICPMCKKEFPEYNLNELTEHVNGHFSEGNNMAIDSNFEIVTHTVGNF